MVGFGQHDGTSPLLVAVEGGFCLFYEELIDAGANVNYVRAVGGGVGHIVGRHVWRGATEVFTT